MFDTTTIMCNSASHNHLCPPVVTMRNDKTTFFVVVCCQELFKFKLKEKKYTTLIFHVTFLDFNTKSKNFFYVT